LPENCGFHGTFNQPYVDKAYAAVESRGVSTPPTKGTTAVNEASTCRLADNLSV
jgi:hypothetical protein